MSRKKTIAKKNGTNSGAKKATKSKASKAKGASANGKPKKPSALAAAAKVLGESKEPMTTGQMIGAMAAKGYWTSPGGQTPDRTLYSAIARELNTKGKQSRFVKLERGKFALNA